MPKQLHTKALKDQLEKPHSSAAILSKNSAPLVKNCFPSMFDSKSPYQYINEEYGNLKVIAHNYDEKKYQKNVFSSKSKKIVSSIKSIVENKETDRGQKIVENLEKSEVDKEKSNNNIKEKTNHNIQQKQEIQQSQTQKQQTQKSVLQKNPFVSIPHNFKDPFCNSKTLNSSYPYIKYGTQTPNMTSIAQQSKQKAFNSSVAFPTRVMTGNLAFNNQRGKQFESTVGGVMKYSIGVSRGASVTGTTSGARQNPFNRAPKNL